MTGTIRKRIAKLEARRQGHQIPIFCEEESEVPATVDQMIAAGELAEADAELRSLLAQCEAAEQRVNAAGAPETRQTD
jgi:hypothetical protein